MEIPSARLGSLSYSLSGNTDRVKYIKREIIKACTDCYNGSEEQVRINREETSCQKSEHYPRYGTDQVTHTRSCATFIRAEGDGFTYSVCAPRFLDSES